MRIVPIPRVSHKHYWALSQFDAILVDILQGCIGPNSVESLIRASEVIDIDDFDFMLAIVGADPETTNWLELNKLALELLIAYVEGEDDHA